ncbi:hypothetical protein [Caulobacter sp. DWR3-1-2]|uniref:hypothetical protein n=1 Tax=Caulobacter sp. DWR3-1-2 TaxID=2804647 RepID=UPI003CEF5DCD
MSPEELMRDGDRLLVELHIANLFDVQDTTALRTPAEQTKLLGSVAFTARRMNATVAASRRSLADVMADARAIKASRMKAQAAKAAANENDENPSPEMEMDDDSGRTPERVAAFHTEIQRRLAALVERREAKGMGRQHPVVGLGASDEGLAAVAGPSPESPI